MTAQYPVKTSPGVAPRGQATTPCGQGRSATGRSAVYWDSYLPTQVKRARVGGGRSARSWRRSFEGCGCAFEGSGGGPACERCSVARQPIG